MRNLSSVRSPIRCSKRENTRRRRLRFSGETHYFVLGRWRGRRLRPGVHLHTNIYVDVLCTHAFLSFRFRYLVNYIPQQETDHVEGITRRHRELILVWIRLLGDDIIINTLYC
jgi:hypothetical protein